MKRTIVIIIVFVSLAPLMAQKADTTEVNLGKKNIVTITESKDQTEVRVNDDFVVVDETADTVKVKLGNKAISIIEKNGDTHVEIIEMDEFEKYGWKQKKPKYKGHWAGYEMGLNNFVDRQGNLAGATTETQFLDLNTGKSWEYDLNFMQFSIPMGQSIGWVTGLGMKWNRYHFDNNLTIGKDPVTGVIVPILPPDGVSYDKTRLTSTYLTLPLLLEFQFGPNKKGFVSVGLIGDLKLSSRTFTRHYEEGSKVKSKVKDDFNLSPLRYHLTARAGYKFVKIFANYSMVPLFEPNMGPEVYPVTVGLTLISFR